MRTLISKIISFVCITWLVMPTSSIFAMYWNEEIINGSPVEIEECLSTSSVLVNFQNRELGFLLDINSKFNNKIENILLKQELKSSEYIQWLSDNYCYYNGFYLWEKDVYFFEDKWDDYKSWLYIYEWTWKKEQVKFVYPWKELFNDWKNIQTDWIS